jgi:hypothetical protein
VRRTPSAGTRFDRCSPSRRSAHQASFYAAAFLVTFLFAQVFWPATRILMEGARLVALGR